MESSKSRRNKKKRSGRKAKIIAEMKSTLMRVQQEDLWPTARSTSGQPARETEQIRWKSTLVREERLRK